MIHPNFLRSEYDRFYTSEGDEIAWYAQEGDAVFLLNSTRHSSWHRLFELSPDQLASMLIKAIRTQEHANDEEHDLLDACRAYLAMRDAEGE